MIILRLFLVLASIYLTYKILPFIFAILLYPFIAGGKNEWVISVIELFSLFTGLLFAWGLWRINPETKKKRIISLFAVILTLFMATIGFQYNHYQKQIMGNSPVDAAKNVILLFDPDADVSSFDFIKHDGQIKGDSAFSPDIGQIVSYTVKADGIAVYEVSVIKGDDKKWRMLSHWEIRN
ncbi:MAG: hypothetical protein LAT67_12405 [Balneolales bacterium]|nr:hypothetical protein [Balneolales bacterium]